MTVMLMWERPVPTVKLGETTATSSLKSYFPAESAGPAAGFPGAAWRGHRASGPDTEGSAGALPPRSGSCPVWQPRECRAGVFAPATWQ